MKTMLAFLLLFSFVALVFLAPYLDEMLRNSRKAYGPTNAIATATNTIATIATTAYFAGTGRATLSFDRVGATTNSVIGSITNAVKNGIILED